jgi:hypothetical protein
VGAGPVFGHEDGGHGGRRAATERRNDRAGQLGVLPASGWFASAWFKVDWKFSGQSVGQVRITPSGTQQGAQPLRVEARMEEGRNRDASTVSLVVRFTYRFSTADGPDQRAHTELTLFSDGPSNSRAAG